MFADVSGHAFELPLPCLKWLIECQLHGGAGPLICVAFERPSTTIYRWQKGGKTHASADAVSGKADAARELWQTECSFGTVFRLRVSLVRMQQARREKASRRSELLPVTEQKPVTGKNGSEVHTEFLHHRAH
jgi:hypothetical protein